MNHYTTTTLANTNAMPARAKIVVVGAGMAGLYSTWRLLNETAEQDIVILEKHNRTGGRLDSDIIDFPDHEQVREEEGGMRFTFENMGNLMALFLDLGLCDQIVPFPMNSGGNNRLYFRGQSFTNAEAFTEPYGIWARLYHLEASEQGINPDTIINTVFNRILAANPHFKERPKVRTPAFWQRFWRECQWDGVSLKDWTLWNLMSVMGYSNECITMLSRLSGFNSTFRSQANAGVAYQLLEDFPDDPGFKTLKDGYSMLPNRLVEEIGIDKIFTETTVENIEQTGAGQGYTLAYTRAGEGGAQTIQAERVILALPRQALERLFIRSDGFGHLGRGKADALWNTLQTTTNQPMLKINLYYEKAWWGNGLSGQPSVAFGPNFSDLPLGSVYPFYAIDEPLVAALAYEEWVKAHGQKPSDEIKKRVAEILRGKYEKPAALTIYCDYLNINFWKALQQNGPLFSSPMQKKYTHMEPQTLYAASEAVVTQATEFFKKLFNTHYAPRPMLTSARIWDGNTRTNAPASEQFGYGIHLWALHADAEQSMAELVEPLENLFTCGEAFSDYQGWVEGALRSANLVLERAFNLKPISQVYEETHGVASSVAIRKRYNEQSQAMIRQYIDPDFSPDVKESKANE